LKIHLAQKKPVRSLQQYAAELAALKVDAILTHATAGALAAVRATKTIPVVAADGSDPVAAGLVANLGRPGAPRRRISRRTAARTASTISAGSSRLR
jgi:ABC-type uncharacterized transport system substrate-binding protein